MITYSAVFRPYVHSASIVPCSVYSVPCGPWCSPFPPPAPLPRPACCWKAIAGLWVLFYGHDNVVLVYVRIETMFPRVRSGGRCGRKELGCGLRRGSVQMRQKRWVCSERRVQGNDKSSASDQRRSELFVVARVLYGLQLVHGGATDTFNFPLGEASSHVQAPPNVQGPSFPSMPDLVLSGTGEV